MGSEAVSKRKRAEFTFPDIDWQGEHVRRISVRFSREDSNSFLERYRHEAAEIARKNGQVFSKLRRRQQVDLCRTVLSRQIELANRGSAA